MWYLFFNLYKIFKVHKFLLDFLFADCYMMLSVAQRENTDDKTICELCFCLLDEMEDITFSRSMCIIIEALMDAVMEYFHITETQLDEFAASFMQRLPKYMQEALAGRELAA